MPQSVTLERQDIVVRSLFSVREVIASLSLANFCLLRSWAELPPYLDSQDTFLLRVQPGAVYQSAFIFNLALLTALFLGVHAFQKHHPKFRPLTLRMFVLLVLLILNSVVNYLAPRGRVDLLQLFSLPLIGVGAVTVLVAVLYILVSLPNWFFRASSFLLLSLSPLVPIVIFSGHRWHTSLVTDVSKQTALLPAAGTRLVWIVVDEWDYRLTFIDRPSDVQLSAVETFRKQSVNFTNAYSSASDTKPSIFSMLSGRKVGQIRLDSSDVQLKFPDGSTAAFSSLPNIFTDLSGKDIPASVIGWYLPYCSFLGNWVANCDWWQANFVAAPLSPNLFDQMLLQVRPLLETRNSSLLGQPARNVSYSQVHNELTERLLAEAVNPNVRFIFAHVPYSHRPHIFNRQTGEFDLAGNPVRGYLDGLALWDRVLETLMLRLRASEIGARTIVLITADHSCRYSALIDGQSDARVPLLIRFPDQIHSQKTDDFETRNLRKLVSSILINDIDTSKKFLEWFSTPGHD